jgi:hypothetical protein
MRDLGTFRTTALALASSIALVSLSPEALRAQANKGVPGGSITVEEGNPPTPPPQKPMQEELTNRTPIDPISESPTHNSTTLTSVRACGRGV